MHSSKNNVRTEEIKLLNNLFHYDYNNGNQNFIYFIFYWPEGKGRQDKGEFFVLIPYHCSKSPLFYLNYSLSV